MDRKAPDHMSGIQISCSFHSSQTDVSPISSTALRNPLLVKYLVSFHAVCFSILAEVHAGLFLEGWEERDLKRLKEMRGVGMETQEGDVMLLAGCNHRLT